MAVAWADFDERRKVADRHHLEKRIRALEGLPRSPLVRDEIERLRRELSGRAR
jgi:hypothetical protein